MPAEDWPSFHCRPSTVSTFLPASLSIRQMPTTGTSDFGSAPAVSPETSTVVGGPAASVDPVASRPTARTVIIALRLELVMGRLLGECKFHMWRPTAGPP